MIAHLLPAILPRWTIFALVAWLSTLVLAIWAWESVEEEPPGTLPPDTVRAQRTITKTDTVTETVPRTVVRYDTVRVTDTLKMPVPQGASVLGVLPPSPLDLGTTQATLTYWTGTRWQQEVYALPVPDNRLAAYARGAILPGTPALTAGLAYTRRLGDFAGADVEVGGHLGYAITPERQGLAGGPHVRLTWDW